MSWEGGWWGWSGEEVEAIINTRGGHSRRCCTPAGRRNRAPSWDGVSACPVERTRDRTPNRETPCAGCPRDRGKRAAGSYTYSWTSSSRAPSRRGCSGTCLPPTRKRSGTGSGPGSTSPAAVPCCCCWSRSSAACDPVQSRPAKDRLDRCPFPNGSSAGGRSLSDDRAPFSLLYLSNFWEKNVWKFKKIIFFSSWLKKSKWVTAGKVNKKSLEKI